MDWLAIVAVCIALYAAVLSTRIEMRHRKREKRSVKVELKAGFLTHGSDIGEKMFFISAANTGHRPVTLTQPRIDLHDGNKVFFLQPQGDVSLPHELLEGKGCQTWIKIAEIKQQLQSKGHNGSVELTPVFVDATGTEFKGKSVMFDFGE